MTNALNLDELFGQAKTISVTHNAHDYELLRPEGLGPRQSVKIQKMQARAIVLQELGEKINDDQAAEIETILGDMIKVISPEFPVEELSFQKKIRIVAFYMEETYGKKKTRQAMKKAATGAKRSRK